MSITSDQAELRERIRGPVLTGADQGFGEATRLWNGLIEKSPAAVAQPTGAADVVEAVLFARDNGIPLSIRGGGHNIAGTALADGGLTIDMSRLRGIIVDPGERTATVQPGCLLGDVDRETQLHGLATPLGFISEVGMAGLTLGGGMGYLTRRFGWTVDNLLEVEVVTADGELRRASRDENADLFWGVRGAGANLGAVTKFVLRLHEVGPSVHGGLIAWPFERAAELLPAYREITSRAPRELSVWMNLLRAPAAPFVPADWQGRRVCGMAVCYSGDLESVDETLAPLRALGEPVFDLLGTQPYVQVQSMLDGSEPAGHHYYWKNDFLSELSDELFAVWPALFADCPIPDAQFGLLHLGGALNDREADDGAIGNRETRYVCGLLGNWAPGTEGAEAFPGWIRDAWREVHPFSVGNYVNLQTDDEGEQRIRETYGGNFDRLVELKRRYDPDNLFRSNRNVAP